MKTLYLECNMGAAGDMLMAALLELLPNEQAALDFIDRMNHIGIPGVRLAAEPAVKCGISGTHAAVTVNGAEEESCDAAHEHHSGEYHSDECHSSCHAHGHHHSGMHEIEHIVSHLAVSEKVRADIMAVYGLIAEAESHAHGKPVEQIHFHEVGAMDAVADIAGVSLLMEMLSPERVLSSPVHVGCGEVRCAHGLLPVPAPATARLLTDVPIYGGTVRGELCTPTGAALLRHFVQNFGGMPVMRVSKIGYGMGKKDFEAANCVRALLGETDEREEQIAELCCNLDDMTPEAIGFAQEQLFKGGALDVTTTAVGMKKNRPGVLLSCMCRTEDRERMIRLIFKNTSTLGVREYLCNRYTLGRTERTVQTGCGTVCVKESSGWGVTREKPAYEDIARIAREKDAAFGDILQSIREK